MEQAAFMGKKATMGAGGSRKRAVRVYLSDEEHALMRQAAAKQDKSYAEFSVDAIVAAARAELGAGKAKKP